MSATGAAQTRPGMPRPIVFLLAALAALMVSLFASGAFLLFSSRTTDSASTWVAAACLLTTGALIVLTRLLLRGSGPAWLLTCVISGVVLAASGAAAIYAFAHRPDAITVGDTTTVIETEPTLIESAGNASPLVIAGAAWAIAVLLRPATRRELQLRG